MPIPARKYAATVDASLAISAIVYIAVVVCVRSSRWTVDDAFVVARYADHLAHHGSLAFNLGAPPVEGFTSPLAVAWAAIAARLGLDPIAALEALGAASTVAGAPLVWVLGRELRTTAPAPGIATLAYATMGEHVSHARSGLETAVHVSVTLALALALARALARPNASVVALAILASVGVVTRPEGAVVALVAVALVVARRRSDRRIRKTVAVAFALPVVVFVAGRAAYFGAFVPNTFWAKTGPWSSLHLGELLELFADLALPLVFAAGAAIATCRLMRISQPLPSPRQRLLVAFATIAVLANVVVYARSLLFMDYAKRFAWHSLGAGIVIALVVTSVAARAIRRIATKNDHAAAALAILLVVAPVTTALRGEERAERYRRIDASYEAMMKDAYAPIVALLRDELPRDATIATYPDSGVVPYLTELRDVDFGRLTDRHLAREAHSPADVVDYFFRTAPAAYVVSELAPGVMFDEGAEAIAHDPRFGESYVLRARFAAERGGALLVYYRGAR